MSQIKTNIKAVEMAEEEVSYTSVTIKSKKQPQAEGKNEHETVYDEVKVNKQALDDAEVEKQNGSVQQIPDTKGLLPDKEAERCRRYQQLCCCFGTLCVVSLLSVIGVCVYFVTVHESTASELNQLKSNQKDFLEKIHNLTDLNNKLSSNNDNLTLVSMALKNKITTLTAENHNLTLLNEELKEQRENLTEIIESMEETSNELNVSRAQWSIDEYCLKTGGKGCTSCQKGWNNHMSSCYVHNNAPPSDQKTWEEAREYCKTKNSDLTVVSNQTEKAFVDDNSWAENEINGYWIGLRAVKGEWKWINGSGLTDLNWIQHQNVVDGYCVTSRNDRGWNTMNCNDKNAWICEKKALSV